MKLHVVLLGASIVGFGLSTRAAGPVYADLQALFDTDVVLEQGGTGLTDLLDPARDRIDANSLPASYQDGGIVTSSDGRTTFKFANLKQASLDAVAFQGQLLDVPDQKYGSVDLALLAAPGSYASPFSNLIFRYEDGSSDERRLGPVPGWFASPTAFDHTWFSYTDSSSVKSLISFKTDWGDDEAIYLAQSRGNGNSGGNRFVDANGYALYLLPIPADVTSATLGITVGNNFVVSLATEFHDPEESFTDGYTEVANSMTIYNGFEHRSLGNLKLYEFDLQPFLAKKTGELYVLLTDATPSNGWGPYLQNMSVYSGKNVVFEQTLTPQLDASNATVYAEFLTDGGKPEKPYLYSNSGSGPSNRHHRFADAGGSITYRFDLPDTVTDAKVMVDMANNFIVSVSGPTSIVRYAQVSPGASDEQQFLLDEGNSILGNNFRFADGGAYMVYQFDLPDDVTTAIAQVSVGNQFVVGIAPGTEAEFETVKDWVAETGEEPRDLSNFATYEFVLDPYLKNNPQKIVRIRLSDGQPGDGWGPYLTGIAIVNQGGASQQVFKPVLNSMEMFGADVHDEFNKGYYTVDLSSVLASNNPKKEVFVRFTDQSVNDGWGPGIFWMAVYSGTLQVESDGLVFKGLKAVNGQPDYNGISLLRRRYETDGDKVLKEIVLPANPAQETSKLYLMGATLNVAESTIQPSLSAQLQGKQLRISWPVSASGYALQSAVSVKGPWTAESVPTETQGNETVAMVPVSGAAKYLRLAK